MFDYFESLFDTSGFPARWHCGQWSAGQGWLHILSDLGVWSAYLAIPCVLGYFVQRKKDVPFRSIFLLFGAFILACGSTHLMDAVVFWWPAYRLVGVLKLFTALVSWATVFALMQVAPKVLAMRHREEFQQEIEDHKRGQEIAERQATLLNLAHDGIIARDLENRVTYWNQGAEAMYGWDKVQALGQVTHQLFRTEFPEPLTDIMEKLLLGGQWEGELVHTRKDGSRIVVWSRWALQRDGQGQPEAVLEINREITDRKRAEEALREQTQLMEAILHSMGEGVVVADVDGRFILFNPAAEAILGLALAEASPTSWSDDFGIFTPDASTPFPSHELPLAKAIRGETTDDCELFVRNAVQSSGCPITVTGRPMLTEAGTLRGGVAVFRDISARKLVEEQTKASLREKEVLLREIHHRVKNNLQIVSTLLDLQSDQIRDPQAVALFQESRGRVHSMALIHERLYRSDNLALVNMAEYVERLTEDLLRSYQASSGDVGFVVAVEMALFPIDLAIPCGLLLNELLTNCLKHAFKDGRDGTITIDLRPGGDGSVVLSVTDDGCGFPAGFDFRNSTSFGLQLVIMLVEQLQGVIALDTIAKSCFTITFPLTN